jgi:hypothetical protein
MCLKRELQKFHRFFKLAYEPIEKLRRMERLWSLHSNWRSNGNLHRSYQAVFYVHLSSYTGFSYYPLYDPCILEKHEKLYEGHKKKPMVLSINKNL